MMMMQQRSRWKRLLSHPEQTLPRMASVGRRMITLNTSRACEIGQGKQWQVTYRSEKAHASCTYIVPLVSANSMLGLNVLQANRDRVTQHKLGTLKGVFLPCFQNILGKSMAHTLCISMIAPLCVKALRCIVSIICFVSTAAAAWSAYIARRFVRGRTKVERIIRSKAVCSATTCKWLGCTLT